MTLRRIIILAGILLILFLAMYSWNQRTRALDNLAAEVGLELAGAVLKPLRAVQDSAQLVQTDPARVADYVRSDIEVTRSLYRFYAGYFFPAAGGGW